MIVIFNITILIFVIGAVLFNWGLDRYMNEKIGEKIISTLYSPVMNLLKSDPSNYSEEKYNELKVILDKEMEEFLPTKVNAKYIWRVIKMQILWGLGFKHKALKLFSFYDKVKHIAN